MERRREREKKKRERNERKQRRGKILRALCPRRRRKGKKRERGVRKHLKLYVSIIQDQKTLCCILLYPPESRKCGFRGEKTELARPFLREKLRHAKPNCKRWSVASKLEARRIADQLPTHHAFSALLLVTGRKPLLCPVCE